MKKILLGAVVVVIGLTLAGCGGDPTAAPAQPVTYTAAQVAECQAAENSFSASAWVGQDLAAAIGGDVATDRATVLSLIHDSLASETSVTAPSLVAPQWDAMVSAMKQAEPVFAAPMTQAQYKTDLDNLWATIAAFDTPCEAAISWGRDNLPH